MKALVAGFALAIFVSTTSASRGSTSWHEQLCDGFATLAEEGDVDSQIEIANCYLLGRGRPRDEQEAIQWLRKAVSAGSLQAKATLGAVYLFRLESPEKYAEGVQLIREAVNKGYTAAEFTLGLAYLRGLGVSPDISEAVHLFSSAGNSGYPLPALVLYAAYQFGLYGITPDRTKASYWKERFLQAMANLTWTTPRKYVMALKDDYIAKNILFDSHELSKVMTLADELSDEAIARDQ